jgi:hypothetical protein
LGDERSLPLAIASTGDHGSCQINDDNPTQIAKDIWSRFGAWFVERSFPGAKESNPPAS